MVCKEKKKEIATRVISIKDFARKAIFLALPLTSKLDAIFGGNAHLLRFAQ